MTKYNRNTQSGDLTGAIERARKNRVVQMSKEAKAMLAGLTLMAAAGGYALLHSSKAELAPEEYVAGQFLVKFDEGIVPGYQIDGNVVTGIDEIDALNDELQGEIYTPLAPHSDKHELDNIYLVDIDDSLDLEEIMEDFADVREVEYVVYDGVVSVPELLDVIPVQQGNVQGIEKTPNDPYFNSKGLLPDPKVENQWGHHQSSAPEAWETITGADFITVAVLDTGIDPTHPDLEGRVRDDGYNFADNNNDTMDRGGHGTAVSGVIAAATDNGIGIAGTTWLSQLLPVKVLGDNGSGSISSVMRGIVYAAEKDAQIISMSLSGRGGPHQQPIDEAIEYAHSEGLVVVVGAGNDNHDAKKNTPANNPLVITVSAIDHKGEKAYFSNWGKLVDVAGPGVDILTIVPLKKSSADSDVPEGYMVASGTSLSTPYVSGEVVLILAANPELIDHPDEVKDIVREAVDEFRKKPPKYMGTGIMNLAKAVEIAQEHDAEASDVPPHLERVEYFLEERPDEYFNMEYIDQDFNEAAMWTRYERIRITVGHLSGKLPFARPIVRIIDGGGPRYGPADGTLDLVGARWFDRSHRYFCAIDFERLPDEWQNKLTEHYETSSEAFYRHITEGLESYESNIGIEEMRDLYKTCKELNGG